MAQYDSIASAYADAEHHRPERTYIYDPALFSVLGDISGLKVLDLACGDGNITRQLAHAGAVVMGVDECQAMVDLAELHEKKDPLGIRYVQGRVGSLGKIGSFDVVVGSLLLHYASSKEELYFMCRDIVENLKVGGRFVALNQNPEHPLTSSDPKYGSIVEAVVEPLLEGGLTKITIVTDGKVDCSFVCYFWQKDTYEEAMRDAGLSELRWHSMGPTQEGIDMFGEEFWADYPENDSVVVVQARR